MCVDTYSHQKGEYVGHDEPSVLFKSGRPGSGNDMTYTVTLPRDPKKQPNASGKGGTTWNFQLRPTFWFGLTMCDTESAPEFTKKCTPDSDRNNLVGTNPAAPDYIGKHPGNDLAARFGRDGAHAEWFYGFRLAVKTDLGSRIVRTWGIVPAAVNEREVAEELLAAGPPPPDLLADKGFAGKAFTAAQATRSTAVLVPPAKGQRASMPAILQKVIAEWRNRVETTFKEITDQMELARHGAHTFWGLLTRTAATIAAHTLLRVCLAGA